MASYSLSNQLVSYTPATLSRDWATALTTALHELDPMNATSTISEDSPSAARLPEDREHAYKCTA